MIRTKLAGTSHYQDNRRKWAAPGMSFSLIREPKNPHDPNAIRVAFLNDTLGYIPKELSKALAPQMDAGKEMCASFVKLNKCPGADTVGITVDIEEY